MFSLQRKMTYDRITTKYFYMQLDFKEIPQANIGSGLQDTFELFTRDFLQYLGYRIVSNPDRGADGKKDLIVDEVIQGITSEYTIRWLVSCKHYAHSGAAVKDIDEPNIIERLKQHKCDGFMGVYSTLSANSLKGLLTGIENNTIFDHELIEGLLLRDAEGQHLAARYFPKSYASYRIENPVPANLFSDVTSIHCEVCGADLLAGKKQGVYITLTPFMEDDDNKNVLHKYNVIKEIHFACKGDCDHNLREKWHRKYIDHWEDVDDLKNPTLWIRLLMAFINGIYEDNDLSFEAFKVMKHMFLCSYPYVARNMTTKEKEHIRNLIQFGLID